MLRDADRLYPGEDILPLVTTLWYFRATAFTGAASVEVFRPRILGAPHQGDQPAGLRGGEQDPAGGERREGVRECRELVAHRQSSQDSPRP